MRLGKFITVEGVDGAGKSTHIATIASFLKSRGLSVVISREPGGTALGEILRTQLLTQEMGDQAELLLIFAARAEHLRLIIKPALAQGKWVICDRFVDATHAYQGGGRQMPSAPIAFLEQWIVESWQPDRTYLFDLPIEVAAQRLQETRQKDRFEQEDQLFFERTRNVYQQRAANWPTRFCVIDASKSINFIQNIIQEDLASLCIN